MSRAKIGGRQLGLFFTAIALSGCDPYQKVVVRSVDGTGKNVGGVKLELFCPANFPWRVDAVYPLGTSDENGVFSQEGVGATPKRCIVRAVGRDEGVLVEKACTKSRPVWGSCLEIEAVVPVRD
jgi:hypothetical protein